MALSTPTQPDKDSCKFITIKNLKFYRNCYETVIITFYYKVAQILYDFTFAETYRARFLIFHHIKKL